MKASYMKEGTNYAQKNVPLTSYAISVASKRYFSFDKC